MTRKRREGIRQPLTKTSKSEEERAVHEDVTKGPCTSTFVLINIATSAIEAAFVEIKCGPSIREVTKETTSVRFQTSVSAGAKGTKGVTHTEVRTEVLGILGFDGLSHRGGSSWATRACGCTNFSFLGVCICAHNVLIANPL
jgi:hypothetical protein